MRRSNSQERNKTRERRRNEHDLSEVEPEVFQSIISGSTDAGTPGFSFKAHPIVFTRTFVLEKQYEATVIFVFRMPMVSSFTCEDQVGQNGTVP